jgi:LmbE family N-acetylglucosaminyl deacetylase
MLMDWIYFSPHLDDVALSLGGLVWEQTQAGQDVSIWTICAGDPPTGPFSPFAQSLHTRWEVGREASEERREEDIESCRRLGASYHHFDIPDCIYRRSPQTGEYLYVSEDALWAPVHPDERELITAISRTIRKMLPSTAKLVCPLMIGNHVDHRLTRAAVEGVGASLYYYADYPYVLGVDFSVISEDFKSSLHTLTPSGLLVWQDAVAAHRSQISTFWKSQDEMRFAILAYYNQMGGIWLGSK